MRVALFFVRAAGRAESRFIGFSARKVPRDRRRGWNPPAIVIALVAKIPLPSSRNGRQATWMIQGPDLGVKGTCQRVGRNGRKQPIEDI